MTSPPPPPQPPGSPPPEPTEREFPVWLTLLLAAVVVLTLVGGTVGAYLLTDHAADEPDETALTTPDGWPPLDEPVTVGIADQRPYGYLDETGEAVGFGPDIARAVLTEMGYTEVEFEVVEFKDLTSGLVRDHLDLTAAGAAMTPRRMRLVQFSHPTFCVLESLAVPTGNPDGIVDFSSFVTNPEFRLGVLEDSPDQYLAQSAGVRYIRLEFYPDLSQLLAAVETREVNAAAFPHPWVMNGVLERSDLEAVEPFLAGPPPRTCGGHMFAQENSAFRDAFNDQLDRLRRSGATREFITEHDWLSVGSVTAANEFSVEDFEE